MLAIHNIYTCYDDTSVLNGVSIKVPHGSVVALLGRNGMGKTTVIRSIVGFNPPKQGSINFNGTEITQLEPYLIARMGIGLVPQGRHIFPSLNVEENLLIAARGSGKNGNWSLDKVYSLFPVLKERSKYKGTLLSGGEQQMLAIGRALMTNSDLLLMDEPSEGLAPLMVREIMNVIGQLKSSGFSILLVEQNLHMALKLADYIYIISKGVIVYQAEVEAFKNEDHIWTKYLGVAK